MCVQSETQQPPQRNVSKCFCFIHSVNVFMQMKYYALYVKVLQHLITCDILRGQSYRNLRWPYVIFFKLLTFIECKLNLNRIGGIKL